MRSFPPEILSHLKAFLGPGTQLKLWCCGDRELQAKLRCDAFRRFELTYSGIHDIVCPVSRFPICVLSQWKELYQLKIDLSDRVMLPCRPPFFNVFLVAFASLLSISWII